MDGGARKEPAIVDWARRTFRAFRYRDFRLLWLGAFTSTTGTWMQMVAQSWVVLQLTGSAFYLGLVSFLGQLPILFFSLIGGAFADRVDRRKLLLFSQYVQMAVAVLLTILVAGGWVEVWHFLVLVFVAGSGQAFGGPAYQALLPTLVDREDVPNAVALNSIQFNLARMVGPVLAGGAFAAFGAAICFGLNALSFLAVILALLAIRSRFIPPRREANLLQDIGQGFRYVRSRGALWQLTILGFASTFCGVPLLTLLPVFAKDVFGLDAAGYSYMMAVSGAGSILGAVVYASYSRRTRQGRFTVRMQLVLALLIGLFAVSRALWLSCLLLFLGGAGLISLFAAITSLVQLATEEGMRGRMMSIFMLAFRGGMPLGDLLAGFLAATFTPTAALLVLACLLAAVSLGVQGSRAGVTRL
ncbi:MAG: MFS transporter [Acidobacteriota bacterium]